MNRSISAGLVVLVFIGGFLLYRHLTRTDTSGQQQPPGRRPPLVATEPARLDRIEEILETTAEIVATISVTIRATIEGPIAFLPWREGDIVETAGQTLVEIDRSIYRQEVLAAEAALAVAEASLADLKAGARHEEIAQAAETVRHLELSAVYAGADRERVETLVSSGAIPGEEAEHARLNHVRQQAALSSARQGLAMLEAGPTATAVAVQEARVEEARARLGLARAVLSECTISAPFSGVVTEVFAYPGDLASVREPLLRLIDNDSLVVRFAIPESQASGVRAGSRATIRLDAMPGRSLEGRVERVYPEIHRQTRTRTAEAILLDEVEDLVPGLFARIEVPVRSVEGAVIVPERAVLTTARGERVVFVLEDGKARRRPTTTGIEQGQIIQLLEGVRPGEEVIIAGHENLRDGAEVRVARSAGVPGGDRPGQGAVEAPVAGAVRGEPEETDAMPSAKAGRERDR